MRENLFVFGFEPETATKISVIDLWSSIEEINSPTRTIRIPGMDIEDVLDEIVDFLYGAVSEGRKPKYTEEGKKRLAQLYGIDINLPHEEFVEKVREAERSKKGRKESNPITTAKETDNDEDVEKRHGIVVATTDTAIKSRSFTIDMNVTPEEVLDRIESLLNNIGNGAPMEAKKEVLEFLREGDAKNMNFRSFILALRARMSGVPNWQRLLKYTKG